MAALQPNQVLCYCTKRCGGPAGPGTPRAYSTRNTHMREDAASLSAEFTNSLANSSRLAGGPGARPVRLASELESGSGDGPNTDTPNHKRIRRTPVNAPITNNTSLSTSNLVSTTVLRFQSFFVLFILFWAAGSAICCRR
jgi:hypothetical protein